ncbi:MAG: alcohol dehydrogenase [Rhodospirillaceae bacterium]|nr:alcohol dehydrogenase [Rhodospirillaceae bacterium]|tara:strand:- start:97 stop:921 length:825 start_codon:yes stop_codon:yes gene_type:complete
MSFEDKTLVVTGTASGIGAATSALLIERGAHVIGLDLDEGDGPASNFVRCDLSNPAEIDNAIAKIDRPLHGLANVAGVPGSTSGETVMRVNVLGLRHLTEALLPRLEAGSAVVHVASGAGAGWRERLAPIRTLLQCRSFDDGLAWVRDHPMDGPEAYNFSKEVVIVYALAGSMLARPHGVRSLSISPGAVETPILKDFYDTMGKDILDRLKEQSGGRNGTPDDIARIIAFALSDDAAWLNGTDIGADGGSEVALSFDLVETSATDAVDAFFGRG